MLHLLADLVSDAMNLPSWAPKVARRTAAVVLILTVLLAPDSFRAGFELWVKTQTEVMMDRAAPLLSPEPAGLEPDLPAR